VPQPAPRDLNAYQGDDFTHEVRFVNSSGSPVNVTGRTFGSQVRRRWSDTTIDATFAVDTSNAATGVVVFTLSASVMTAFEPGTYRYDLQQVAGGRRLTLLKGKFVVDGEITR
jgi:hypothetical protein